MSMKVTRDEFVGVDRMGDDELRDLAHELLSENAKLRDAMYTNAGKHALQHMDEDELRIWATQQEYLIEELRELLSMYMTLAGAVASGISIQNAYADGMGRKMDETEMRERAMELGIEWCR